MQRALTLPEWQARVREYMSKLKMTQSKAASAFKITERKLESWMASPGSSWHREPSWLEMQGAMTILKKRWRNNKPSDRGPLQNGTRAERKLRRTQTWPTMSLSNAARLDHISNLAARKYAERYNIQFRATLTAKTHTTPHTTHHTPTNTNHQPEHGQIEVAQHTD